MKTSQARPTMLKHLSSIPEDDDDDDGSNSEFTPETLPNAEGTVCTSSSGSSDVAPTLDRTDEGASIGEREARTSAIPGSDPITDRVSSRRYPSRSHRPPTRFDNYVRL